MSRGEEPAVREDQRAPKKEQQEEAIASLEPRTSRTVMAQDEESAGTVLERHTVRNT